MSHESFEHLKKHPNQSFLSERYKLTEILRTKREDRTLEQNIGFIPVWLCFGDSIYDTNTFYSPPLENIWTINTMYSEKSIVGPSKAYEFGRFRPDGQCGSSDIVAAKLTDWSEFKNSGEIAEVKWAEGRLWVQHEGKWVMAGDHHAWYNVKAADGRSWVVDLAAYQYRLPGAQMRVVMQGQDGHKTDDQAISGVNRRIFQTRDDDVEIIENAHTLYYDADPKFVVSIGDFKWEDGEGRAEQIVGAKGITSNMTLGDIREGVRINGGDDYPEGYKFENEALGEEALAEQYTSSHISIEMAVDLVRASNEGRMELSVEGLGMVIEDLIKESGSRELAEWAVDCAERSLDCFEQETGDFSQRDIVAELRKCLESGMKFSRQFSESLIILGYVADREMSQNATAALYALGEAARAVRDWDKKYEAAEIGNSAGTGAMHAAMALDFSALDKNIKPVPVSERHWQYLRLYELTHPPVAEEP